MCHVALWRVRFRRVGASVPWNFQGIRLSLIGTPLRGGGIRLSKSRIAVRLFETELFYRAASDVDVRDAIVAVREVSVI